MNREFKHSFALAFCAQLDAHTVLLTSKAISNIGLKARRLE